MALVQGSVCVLATQSSFPLESLGWLDHRVFGFRLDSPDYMLGGSSANSQCTSILLTLQVVAEVFS